MLEKELIEHYNFDVGTFTYLKRSPDAFKAKEIKKHDGSVRTLMIPKSRLKDVQRYVLKKYSFLLEKNKFLKRQYAYMKNRNNIMYAKEHVKKKYLVKYDIEDYFNQITFPRIYGSLLKNGIPDDDAILISQLACYRKNGKHVALAQGSPLSPLLSNLVSTSVDTFFINLEKSLSDTHYSRYADDITLSTDSKRDYNTIIEKYDYINKAMEKRGFKLNEEKYRTIMYGRRLVGGIKVNEKLNLNKDYIDNLKLNLYFARKDYQKTRDLYISLHKEYMKTEDIDLYYRNSLIGKINYLTQVKGETDPKVRKLKELFNEVKEFGYHFEIIDQDLRKPIERSVFPIEFISAKESLPASGTCFYLKGLGIVTCYHNFYSYTKKTVSKDICILIKNKSDEIQKYETKIDPNVLELEEVSCNSFVDRNNDIVFISNEYLEKRNKEYPQYQSMMEGFEINLKKEYKYEQYKGSIAELHGYPNHPGNEFSCSTIHTEITNYYKNDCRFELQDSLGAGGSGGPMLIGGDVCGVFYKGEDKNDTGYTRAIASLIDHLKKNFEI